MERQHCNVLASQAAKAALASLPKHCTDNVVASACAWASSDVCFLSTADSARSMQCQLDALVAHEKALHSELQALAAY